MNVADYEAHADWLAERPDADEGDYYVPSVSLPGLVGMCTCKADTVNDHNHNCIFHPPF